MLSFNGAAFAWTIVPLLILIAVISYMRFMVFADYHVTYESECNPNAESCYIGCEDENCNSKYYYSLVEKYAPNLFDQCGADITDCSDAYVCLPEDKDRCSITYCDPEAEECTDPSQDYDL